jgi:hypothetical protein
VSCTTSGYRPTVIMVRYSVHARAARVWTPALASAMVSDRTRAGGCRMRGRGSAGRASPCQGEGRGFESRRPLGASLAQSLWGAVFPGGVAERRGNGLQIRVHGFKSRLHLGRLAQWERASLTRKRSLVQIQYRPPVTPLVNHTFVRVWRWDRLTCRSNCVGLSLAVAIEDGGHPACDNWAQFLRRPGTGAIACSGWSAQYAVSKTSMPKTAGVVPGGRRWLAQPLARRR